MKKSRPLGKSQSQMDKFISMAKEVEAGGDGKSFDKLLKKIAKPVPKKRTANAK